MSNKTLTQTQQSINPPSVHTIPHNDRSLSLRQEKLVHFKSKQEPVLCVQQRNKKDTKNDNQALRHFTWDLEMQLNAKNEHTIFEKDVMLEEEKSLYLFIFVNVSFFLCILFKNECVCI